MKTYTAKMWDRQLGIACCTVTFQAPADEPREELEYQARMACVKKGVRNVWALFAKTIKEEHAS